MCRLSLMTSGLLAVVLLVSVAFTDAAARHGRAASADATSLGIFSCLDLTDGYYADPATCRMYYVCNDGEARNLPCQDGAYYDPDSSTCNTADLVPCDPPRDTAPLFCDDRPDGLYGNPDDCAGFYQCSAGLTYPVPCTPPLLWNEPGRYCDWPASVAASSPSSCDQSQTFCRNRGHGYYPDPANCSRYYHCAAGKTYTHACDAGEHWNDEVGGCDFIDRARCVIIR